MSVVVAVAKEGRVAMVAVAFAPYCGGDIELVRVK